MSVLVCQIEKLSSATRMVLDFLMNEKENYYFAERCSDIDPRRFPQEFEEAREMMVQKAE